MGISGSTNLSKVESYLEQITVQLAEIKENNRNDAAHILDALKSIEAALVAQMQGGLETSPPPGR